MGKGSLGYGETCASPVEGLLRTFVSKKMEKRTTQRKEGEGKRREEEEKRGKEGGERNRQESER